MTYAYECSKFDYLCPDNKDAKECFWCFTRSITKGLFDTIAEEDTDSSAPLDVDAYCDLVERYKDGQLDDAIKCVPDGIVEHMVFHYGYYRALRRLRDCDSVVSLTDLLGDEDAKGLFHHHLLFASVSFEMNNSIHDYYDYHSRGGEFNKNDLCEGCGVHETMECKESCSYQARRRLEEECA
jgi:hypothetical protein